METSYTEYARMGGVVTAIAVTLLVLHGILLRAKPVKRFLRQQRKYLWLQMQNVPAGAMLSAAFLLISSAALVGFFFWHFSFAMQDVLRDGAFALLKLSLYWVGFLLALDLTCIGGWMFTSSLWTVLSRRKPGWNQSDDVQS